MADWSRDAFFVSGIDHSRDVKKIVAHLKETDRPEYAYPLGLYHSWGQATGLSRSAHYRVEELSIYHGEACTLENKNATAGHLVVARGTAVIRQKGAESRLPKGASLALDPRDHVTLENRDAGPLLVIHTQPQS